MSHQQLVTRAQLRSYFPVNALTDDHLATLMRDREVEYLCRGQVLFDIGDTDNANVYLVHGEIEVSDAAGNTRVISSDDTANKYPLCHRQPRRERAAALSDCSVVRFDSTFLDNMLCWDQVSNCIMADISSQRDLDEDAVWMMTLLKSNLFYKVPPMNIREILNCFDAVVVEPEQVVLRQGELGDCCYVIKEGQADVLRATDERGKSEVVATLDAGRCFGEDALVNETERNATIVMRTHGVLMRLGKADFFKLLRKPAVDVVNYRQAEDNVTAGAQWIDVRTQGEFDAGHHKGATHIPLRLITLKSRVLDKNTRYVTCCNTGTRAQAAAYLLTRQGFNVVALSSGFEQLPDQQRDPFFAVHA
jgi:CRP-like cAMP-binding protein/rhodanese-related sulfurtransferase